MTNKLLNKSARHAETPECWIIKFQLDSILCFGHMIKLSANMHDLS